MRGGIWKGDIMVADIEESEEVDASELHARRLNAKEVLTPQRSGNLIFPVADGTVKIFGEGQGPRTSALTRDRPERREEQEILQGRSDELHSPTPLQEDSTRDDEEAKSDFRTITGEFIYRHHVEPRVKLYMPKEETFPIPMKYIDVNRTIHTSLDVLLEKQIEDHWNVDGERELSDAWTGFTRFILLNGRPPEGYTWSGRRLTRKQTTSRPDDVWPDMWKYMSDAAKKKAKQRWAIEKPKLDNARQLRGIFFIEPNDEEYKLTMKAARRKLEVPMPAAMPCKIPIKSIGKTHRNIGKRKTKYACVVDADESTRPRLEGAGHKPHQDHITAKGTISFTYYSIVHKFIPMPQAFKFPDAKAAVQKECEKLEKIPAWQLTKVRNKKEVIEEARNKGRKVHFASLMDLCHLKKSELEPKYQKYKGRVVPRGVIAKDDSGSYAVFTEEGSSASQMTSAKVMDIIPRLPGCSGQAADAVSAYTQVKMEVASTLFLNSKVRMSRYLDTSTKAQTAKIIVQNGRPSRSSRKESVRSSFGRTIVGKAI